MIRFILCSKVSDETGERLANEITSLQGDKCHLRTERAMGFGGRYIHYGSFLRAQPGESLNTLDAIRLASDKLSALKCMMASGVQTPGLFLLKPKDKCHSGRVFRKSRRHSGNDKPYIVQGMDLLKHDKASGYDYGIEWIEKKDEYRAHVVLGKCVRKQIRVNYNARQSNIRSMRLGWNLDTLKCDVAGLDEIAIAAVRSLYLDFGAVDIIHGTDGKLYVIEVNTAPGLKGGGVKKYAQAFVEWDEKIS